MESAEGATKTHTRGSLLKMEVSRHSLMSCLYLSTNNSISSTKIEVYKRKKPTTKGVLRNRAIKYERETLLVCLFKQKRGGCTCKGLFWLMWHELLHLKTDTWNRCYSAEGFRHDSHSQAHVPRKRALGFCYSVSTDTRTIIQRTTDRLVTKTANQCLFAYHSLHF